MTVPVLRNGGLDREDAEALDDTPDYCERCGDVVLPRLLLCEDCGDYSYRFADD